MSTSTGRHALISGASIAGPTAAFWLRRYGFEPTVVERAPALRGGGYPIDIRGTAVGVVERMGILAQVQAAHIDNRNAVFVDGAGRRIGSVRPEALTGGVEGRDYEVPRGDLAALFFERTRDDVEYVFDDSIAAMREHEDGVDVTFDSGRERTFDLVIGADGLHSNVRRLAFGPESVYERYLGWCFAIFTLPNHLGLSHEAIIYNTPGRMASIIGVGDAPERAFGFLAHEGPKPPPEQLRDTRAMCRLAAAAFAEGAWEIPRMVAAVQDADDAFCDSVSQIYMPSWSTGRIVLTGDAAHAPSFLSGQGTSIALVGAYVLAGEIARRADHGAAFSAYEGAVRSFVEMNQAIAHGSNGVCVSSARELWVRNQAVRWLAPVVTRLKLGHLLARKTRQATTALALPEYTASVL